MTCRLWLAAAFLAAAPAAAQTSTAEQLQQSHTLYDQLELERAARLLRGLLSPQWEAPMERAQRVDALRLLGATLVLVGQPDSAVAQFRHALQLDPFTDLQPEEFTPAQVGAFARARRRVFAVATRPVTAARVDPRTERIRLLFATTHAAAIRAELRSGDSIIRVFETATEGISEFVWDGLTSRGRLAPAGRYELHLRATSRVMEGADSATTYFDLRTEAAPLEDTLPSLVRRDLLPERTAPSAGIAELGKGLAIAGATFFIAGQLASGDLGSDNGVKPAVVATAGLVAGIAAFLAARKTRELPDNVVANRVRQEERLAENEARHTRNAERIAATILLIAPAAGVAPF